MSDDLSGQPDKPLIDEKLSPAFLDWLGKRNQGQAKAVADQAAAIVQADSANEGMRHRDYWRRTQLVAWCEANQNFSRPKGPQ